MPLCAKVKELVDMAEGITPGGGSQVPLPGQERLVSQNTIASVKSDTAQTLTLLEAFAAFLSGALLPYTIFQSWEKQDELTKEFEAGLRKIGSLIQKNKKEEDNAQGELELS